MKGTVNTLKSPEWFVQKKQAKEKTRPVIANGQDTEESCRMDVIIK